MSKKSGRKEFSLTRARDKPAKNWVWASGWRNYNETVDKKKYLPLCSADPPKGLVKRDCVLAQVEGESKSGGLGEAEKFGHQLINSLFQSISCNKQFCQFFMMQRRGIWRVFGLIIGKQGGHHESYLSHMGKGGFLQ